MEVMQTLMRQAGAGIHFFIKSDHILKNKRNVAITYGGDSSEWEVSVWSGQHIALHINRNNYNVYEVQLRDNDWRVVRMANGAFIKELGVQIDKTDFSFIWDGERIRFDVVLIMIHGTPGENGILQSYLEHLHIPYTTSPSFVSALAFDKYACKCHLREIEVQMANDVLLRQNEEFDEQAIVKKLGLPLFVKPNGGGSSFGATKVKVAEEFRSAVTEAFKECPMVLVEEFLQGRELTNGMLKTVTQSLVLPVTEIVSKNDFFDYQAKYKGASDELTPAPIPDSLRNKVQQSTSKIYDYLGCNGFIRVDYIAMGEELAFLEVNTVPGMTEMSLVPQQVRAAGLSMETFIELLIEDTLFRFGRT